MTEQPSTIAARGDLPPRVRELLAVQLAEFAQRATPFLRDTLVQLQQQVASFGQNARNNAEQEDALNCLLQVKRLRSEGMQLLLDALEPRLANIDRPVEETAETALLEKPSLSLSLVEDNQFEESVLIDDLAARAELRFSRQLFELGYRHGALGARTPIEAADLALGPRALLSAIGMVGSEIGLPREFRMKWFQLCDAPLLACGEEIYAGLNQQLIAQGILPNLRPYLPHRGNHPRRRDAQAQTQGEAPAGETALLALRRLLARRRELLKLEANHDADLPAASDEVVQSALTALQQRARTAAQPDAAGMQRTVQHLRQDLLAELRTHAQGDRGLRLSDEQRDTLELIALWFERLLDETSNGGYAQRLLARLQIPFVRAAFADVDVFHRGAHPARHLLNTVTETASLWLDGSEGGIDAALSDRLRQVVDHTLATFDGDIALLEQIAVDLDSHVRAMRHRAETAERRQLEVIQGRARMEYAHAVARTAIEAQQASRKPSLLVRTLLEQAWTDALALTVLREGEKSEAFARRLAVVEQVLREPDTRDDESALLKEIEDGLLQVGLHENEATQLAHRVLDRPAPQNGDATATQTELLVKLKTRQRLGSSADEAIATAPLNDEEQRSLERLRTLPFDTWFECTVNDQGQRVQRKMIWHDGNRHCLLVNARGAPAPECTLEQLARQMTQARARLLPRQEESLIDRTWHSVVAGLRQFARGSTQ